MSSYEVPDQSSAKWSQLLREAEQHPKPATAVINPSFSTNAIHKGQEPEAVHGSINVPIHLSSTYKQLAPGVLASKYDYTRAGNPTVDALNECLASLEHAKFGLTFASGCAATTSVLMTLSPGDHVISIDDVYGGTNRLLNRVLARFGLQVSMINLTPENLEKEMRPNTRVVWIETPTNPTLKIADIEALCRVAKQHGALTVVDNTFASSYLQSPLLLGADAVIHSCTKYIGGHSDVIAGAFLTSNEELYLKVKFNLLSMGACISPFDSYVLLRSVKTLKVRMVEHCKNARAVARFLEAHPKVEKVFYPGLESNEGHEVAKKQMRDFGAMISCSLVGDSETAKKFIGNLKFFTLAESLGGVESLVESPALMTHMSVPKEMREKLGITDLLIRFSVGIENIEDLLDDLEHALSVI